MKCPFCDTEFEMAAMAEYQKELAAASASKQAGSIVGKVEIPDKAFDDSELDDYASNTCPSCGAEFIGGKNTVATLCPNCGNVQIVQKRLSGMLKPQYVIPFKLDKKAAVEALNNLYKGKRLLPGLFTKGNRINSVQPVYFPFWLYDAQAEGRVNYKATKTKSWSDSSYNYTETEYYSVVREGSLALAKVPVDGSERMDDSYMDAIEPFKYSDMKDFDKAFLAGYLAEKYDVDAEQSKERAIKRMKQTMVNEIAKSIPGYTSITPENSNITVKSGKVHYALFPVWILNTKYLGKNYYFLMNGQTGQVAGKLPLDMGRLVMYMTAITGTIGAALTFILYAVRAYF
jgi:predicted RNA-binding Zn-ribbon protein involved in translation (DUF1610 family)